MRGLSSRLNGDFRLLLYYYYYYYIIINIFSLSFFPFFFSTSVPTKFLVSFLYEIFKFMVLYVYTSIYTFTNNNKIKKK